MRKIIKWIRKEDAQKNGRVRRIFKRNGVEMRGQLSKMVDLNQELVSVQAIRG